MIDITIKTLDSQNHSFSVDDELTVKQLKEHIAEPVNVPVESQRLIYCGRVLLDDKKLSEYDVNGKVIHLVQRAPPSSGGGNGGEGRNSAGSGGGGTSGGGSRRPWRTVLNPGGARIESATPGNAMYLGAMAFPADLMDAQGITMPQPRHGLSQSRLSVARTMIRRARYTLQNLENPTHQESPAEVNANNLEEHLSGSIALAAQAATAAAFAAAVSAANAVVQPGAHSATVEGSTNSDQVMSQEEVANTTDAAATPQDPVAPPPEDQQNTQGNGSQNNGGRSRYPGTSALAELVSQMRDVNRRLQPFFDQYYELMRDDPILDNPADAQRVFGQVSEMMHFMAHAYHALSDVMCDFSQPPPRFLRCRPVLIQHSAVLQTGIPIQAQFNLSTNQSSGQNQQQSGSSGGGSTGSSGATASSTTVDTGGSSSAPATNSREETSTSAEATTMRSASEEPSSAPAPTATATSSPASQTQTSGQGVNLGSGNFEFYMDVSPGSITIDSVEATVVTSAATNNSEPTGATIAGPFPWGSQPPPEFIQNLMQALAGQMLGGGGGGSGSASGGGSGSASGGGSGSGSGGQQGQQQSASSSSSSSGGEGSGPTPPPAAAAHATNSQARGNTATHPTTATQTRSTSRPHVHFAPGIQGQTFFDPFLPCNSHHIRASRRRNGSQAAEQASSVHHHHHQQQHHQHNHQQDEGGAHQEEEASDGATSRRDHQEEASTSERRAPSPPSADTTAPPPRPHPNPEIFNLLSGVLGVPVRQSGQGQGGPSVFRILPRDIAILLQGAQLMNVPPGITVAEFLQGLPDHLYTEGQSIFMDLIMAIGRNLRVNELMSVGWWNSGVLITLRPILARFIMDRLLEGRTGSEAVTHAIDRINADIRSFFDTLNDVPMREDVDIYATINQLNHRVFPVIIHQVLEGDEAQYARTLPIICSDYARALTAILLHCCQNGILGLETIFSTLARQLIVGVPPALQNWSITHLMNQLRNFALGLDSLQDLIQQYLVYRMAEVPQSQSQSQSQQPQQQQQQSLVHNHQSSGSSDEPQQQPPVVVAPPEPAVAVITPQQPQPQPMETEPSPETPIVAAMPEPEPLPDVIIGAEPWHNALPPDWVPIITRDRERERRQAVQGPLSDAYLSGMPSKRRKVVTSAKPHGTLARVISESMATAIGAAGVTAIDGIADTAAADTSIRAAYREQVRTTVEATLRNHPDYKPEKYPNAAKYFDRK